MQRTTRLLLGLAILSLWVSYGMAPQASAAGVVGTGTPESCSEAALNAGLTGGGRITFNCGDSPHTITVTTTKAVTTATQIHGGNLITLSGDSVRRLFSVSSDSALELQELTLTGGSATTGGAITTQGTLSISKSTLAGNGASKHGGAIFISGGTVTIADSTLSGNHAPTGNTSGTSGNGGAIYHASGTLTIERSTVSGNVSSRGGGIYSVSATGPVPLTIRNSTVTGNRAGEGGGIVAGSGGPVDIASSTIAENTADIPETGGGITAFVPVTITNSIVAHNGTGGDCAGSITSSGHNLASDTSCSFTQSSDQPTTDPLLSPLLDNGGPTLTYLPSPGSTAIDAGLASCPSPDQRGIPRPYGGACDIGAVEVTRVVGLGSPESCTGDFLAAAIAGGGHISFACGTAPHTIIASAGRDNIISVDTWVEGGQPLISITGAHFTVAAGVRLELIQLRLAGIAEVDGGAIHAFGGVVNNTGGTVVITDSTLLSHAAGTGGAVFNVQGSVDIIRSTLLENRATGGERYPGGEPYLSAMGGAIYNDRGAITITESSLVLNRAAVGTRYFDAMGGAIYNRWGSVTITTSTLSGNGARCDGTTANECFALGGAIYSDGGSVSVVQSTILNNVLSCRILCAAYGHSVSGTGTIGSSIVATTSGPNCSGSVSSLGHNLVSDASCGLTQASDRQNTNPLLGPLGDHGGSTPTHLPQPGSPAIDTGPVTCSSPDQRGLPRPNGAACDRGAVEANAPPFVTPPTYNLPATRLGTTTVPVSIRWSASDADGIQQHRLRRSANGAVYTRDGTFTTTATSKAVTRHLAPDARYRFRAQVTDRAGMTGQATGANVLLLAQQESVACSQTVTTNCIVYTAGWTQRAESDAFGGQVRSSSVSSRRATFRVDGTSVAWVSTLGPGMGKAEVWLDGTSVRTIDLYAATTTTRAIVFVRNGLANSSHTIEIHVLGTKQTASSGTRVDIDAVAVLR